MSGNTSSVTMLAEENERGVEGSGHTLSPGTSSDGSQLKLKVADKTVSRRIFAFTKRIT